VHHGSGSTDQRGDEEASSREGRPIAPLSATLSDNRSSFIPEGEARADAPLQIELFRKELRDWLVATPLGNILMRFEAGEGAGGK
jgi:hypothetical protein